MSDKASAMTPKGSHDTHEALGDVVEAAGRLHALRVLSHAVRTQEMRPGAVNHSFMVHTPGRTAVVLASPPT